jgi:4,5:9,10-diseco-3-hydroxy-5,9,17-trioxoandrosta-1(10),2-diene-4-oate hydrolase
VTDPDGQYVAVGGASLHYHERGSGPALLCIHGGAPGADGWGNFGQNVPALAKHFRTLVPDLPGYGRSGTPAVPGGQYEQQAHAFAAMLGELGVTKAHLVGMATGGGVAVALAIHYPELLDRLVLVSSAGGLPLFSPTPSEGQKLIRDYYRGDGPSLEKMRRYLQMMLYDKSLVTEELVRDRYEKSLYTRTSDAGPREELWQDLDLVTAPTLIIWGRDNRVQGYDNALFMLNRIRDADLHLYGHSGLWVPFEQQQKFEDDVITFLTRP